MTSIGAVEQVRRAVDDEDPAPRPDLEGIEIDGAGGEAADQGRDLDREVLHRDVGGLELHLAVRLAPRGERSHQARLAGQERLDPRRPVGPQDLQQRRGLDVGERRVQVGLAAGSDADAERAGGGEEGAHGDAAFEVEDPAGDGRAEPRDLRLVAAQLDPRVGDLAAAAPRGARRRRRSA